MLLFSYFICFIDTVEPEFNSDIDSPIEPMPSAHTCFKILTRTQIWIIAQFYTPIKSGSCARIGKGCGYPVISSSALRALLVPYQSGCHIPNKTYFIRLFQDIYCLLFFNNCGECETRQGMTPFPLQGFSLLQL